MHGNAEEGYKVVVYTHSSGFEEALSDAVEKRVAKINQSLLIKATKLVKQRPSLHVTARVDVHCS